MLDWLTLPVTWISGVLVPLLLFMLIHHSAQDRMDACLSQPLNENELTKAFQDFCHLRNK